MSLKDIFDLLKEVNAFFKEPEKWERTKKFFLSKKGIGIISAIFGLITFLLLVKISEITKDVLIFRMKSFGFCVLISFILYWVTILLKKKFIFNIIISIVLVAIFILLSKFVPSMNYFFGLDPTPTITSTLSVALQPTPSKTVEQTETQTTPSFITPTITQQQTLTKTPDQSVDILSSQSITPSTTATPPFGERINFRNGCIPEIWSSIPLQNSIINGCRDLTGLFNPLDSGLEIIQATDKQIIAGIYISTQEISQISFTIHFNHLVEGGWGPSTDLFMGFLEDGINVKGDLFVLRKVQANDYSGTIMGFVGDPQKELITRLLQ